MTSDVYAMAAKPQASGSWCTEGAGAKLPNLGRPRRALMSGPLSNHGYQEIILDLNLTYCDIAALRGHFVN